MSFQNYEGFQNQPGQQDASGATAGPSAQQDAPMGGQMPDNGGQFQGGNSGDPGSAGGQQPGSDAKTTLWYDPLAPLTQVRPLLLALAALHTGLSNTYVALLVT